MVDQVHQFTRAHWRKSSRSGGGGTGGGDCVEVADNLADVVAVRDSKDPDGPKVVLDRASFRRLVSQIRSGGHDL